MIPERFWTKVNRNGPIFNGLPCWEWIGRVDKDGYGRFKYDGSDKAAHRYAYINLSGEIPDGKQLDHLCRNRRCVNPVHLEPVISRENIMRGQTLARINLERPTVSAGMNSILKTHI